MTHLLLLLLATSLGLHAAGQSNGPVPLAVIAESEELSSLLGILTFGYKGSLGLRGRPSIAVLSTFKERLENYRAGINAHPTVQKR